MSWMIIPIAATVGFAWELLSEWLLEKLHKPQWKLTTRTLVWLVLATLAWIISWQQETDDRERKATITKLQADTTHLRGQLDVANSSLSKSLELAGSSQKELKGFRDQASLDTSVLVGKLFNFALRDEAETEFQTGVFAQFTGRAAEGERAYRKTLRIKPTHSGARNNLAILLKARGLTNEAFLHYKRAYEANTNDSVAALNYAYGLHNQGRRDAALVIVQNTSDVRGVHATVALELAEWVINFAPSDHFWRYLDQYMKEIDTPDVERILPMVTLHWNSLTLKQKTATSNWVEFLAPADAEKLTRAFPPSP